MRDDPRWNAAPFLLVGDVAKAADWYRDRLGFTYEQLWGEPPSFVMVNRAGVTLMLKQTPGENPAQHVRPNHSVHPDCPWDAYLWVDDAEALYAAFRAKDVKVVETIGERFYGCRDFTIEDLNGYRLCFGQSIEADAQGKK